MRMQSWSKFQKLGIERNRTLCYNGPMGSLRVGPSLIWLDEYALQRRLGFAVTGRGTRCAEGRGALPCTAQEDSWIAPNITFTRRALPVQSMVQLLQYVGAFCSSSIL